jgi:hypothetical protein
MPAITSTLQAASQQAPRSVHERKRSASSAWRPRPRSRGPSTRRGMHGTRPMPRVCRGRPGIGARTDTRGGLGHRHPTLAHGALAQHVDHVVHARRAALGDLGRQEQRRIDGALRIDLPPAHVVLELEHDGLVWRDEPARRATTPGMSWPLSLLKRRTQAQDCLGPVYLPTDPAARAQLRAPTFALIVAQPARRPAGECNCHVAAKGVIA